MIDESVLDEPDRLAGGDRLDDDRDRVETARPGEAEEGARQVHGVHGPQRAGLQQLQRRPAAARSAEREPDQDGCGESPGHVGSTSERSNRVPGI